MEIFTTIHSNGSKWCGEPSDNIDKLIEVLKVETIEERFFESFAIRKPKEKVRYYNHCPIRHYDKYVRFFGNFEKLSHVFRIDTNNSEIIDRLSKAIKDNDGWKKYYEKNLVDENSELINQKLFNFYISFGQTHVHKIGNKLFDKDVLAKICNVEDEPEARDVAFEIFGDKWFTAYNEEQYQKYKHFFPNGVIEIGG